MPAPRLRKLLLARNGITGLTPLRRSEPDAPLCPRVLPTAATVPSQPDALPAPDAPSPPAEVAAEESALQQLAQLVIENRLSGLDLSENDLGADGVALMLQAAAHSRTLRQLALYRTAAEPARTPQADAGDAAERILSGMEWPLRVLPPQLVWLDVGGLVLSDAGWACFASAIATHGRMQALGLRATGLTDERMRVFCKTALMSLAGTLQRLDVSENPFDKPSAKLFQRVIPKLTRLNTLVAKGLDVGATDIMVRIARASANHEIPVKRVECLICEDVNFLSPYLFKTSCGICWAGVMVLLASAAFYLLDMVTDVFVVKRYWEQGNRIWAICDAAIIAVSILVSFILFTWLGVIAGIGCATRCSLHRGFPTTDLMFGARRSSSARREGPPGRPTTACWHHVADALRHAAHLVGLGFVVETLILVVRDRGHWEKLGAVDASGVAWGGVGGTARRRSLTQLRLLRSLSLGESLVEALPQAFLQGYVLISTGQYNSWLLDLSLASSLASLALACSKFLLGVVRPSRDGDALRVRWTLGAIEVGALSGVLLATLGTCLASFAIPAAAFGWPAPVAALLVALLVHGALHAAASAPAPGLPPCLRVGRALVLAALGFALRADQVFCSPLGRQTFSHWVRRSFSRAYLVTADACLFVLRAALTLVALQALAIAPRPASFGARPPGGQVWAPLVSYFTEPWVWAQDPPPPRDVVFLSVVGALFAADAACAVLRLCAGRSGLRRRRRIVAVRSNNGAGGGLAVVETATGTAGGDATPSSVVMAPIEAGPMLAAAGSPALALPALPTAASSPPGFAPAPPKALPPSPAMVDVATSPPASPASPTSPASPAAFAPTHLASSASMAALGSPPIPAGPPALHAAPLPTLPAPYLTPPPAPRPLAPPVPPSPFAPPPPLVGLDGSAPRVPASETTLLGSPALSVVIVQETDTERPDSCTSTAPPPPPSQYALPSLQVPETARSMPLGPGVARFAGPDATTGAVPFHSAEPATSRTAVTSPALSEGVVVVNAAGLPLLSVTPLPADSTTRREEGSGNSDAEGGMGVAASPRDAGRTGDSAACYRGGSGITNDEAEAFVVGSPGDEDDVEVGGLGAGAAVSSDGLVGDDEESDSWSELACGGSHSGSGDTEGEDQATDSREGAGADSDNGEHSEARTRTQDGEEQASRLRALRLLMARGGRRSR